MTMTFVCTLTCGRCKATLRFENERPEWKTYDYRVEEADECERSARFVSQFADVVIGSDAIELPGVMRKEWEANGHPGFLAWWREGSVGGQFFTMTRQISLAIPDPYRYVDCPVCDARVKEPSHGS